MLIIGAFEQERKASGLDPREWVERARGRARGGPSDAVADIIARVRCRQAMYERMADRKDD
jgi:hypothetical protein